ncbi:hypothetical protein BRC60_08550 [Halobacteriales archaeon QH_1_68_42]|nr:MAG: hypothetical protein BRC60_08550 [Halobacteriales archaeon QH_1_68_42]
MGNKKAEARSTRSGSASDAGSDRDEPSRSTTLAGGDWDRRRFMRSVVAGTAAAALGGVSASGTAAAEEIQLDRSKWVASASSTYEDAGYDPSNAIDGQNATHWRPDDGADEWIEIDLGAPESFYKVEMVAPRSETDDNPLFNQWPDEYEVQVRSDTSEQWRTVATASGNNHTESVRFSTQTERYLRVYKTSDDNNWSLGELFAYDGGSAGGGPTPGTPTRPDPTYEGPPTDPETGMAQYGRWTHSLIGAGGYVTGIYTTEANPNVVYHRNDVSGTYRSDDAGEFWYQVHDGYPARGVSVDPRDEDDIVLVKRDGIYHSSRAGENYQDPDLSVEDLWSHPVERETEFAKPNGTFRGCGNVVARDPNDPDLLVAGAIAGGNDVPCLYRSTDGGATWTNLAGSPSGIQTADVRFDPFNPGTVYVASQPENRTSGRSFEAGLWRSTDRGETWEKLTDDAPVEFRFDPDTDSYLYGTFDPSGGNGSAGTVKRSVDGGETWDEFTQGLSGDAFETMAVRPGEVFVFSGESGYGAKTWRLETGNSSWATYNDGGEDTVDDSEWWDREPAAIADPSAVAFDALDPDQWYMTAAYAIYRSTDAGKQWEYSAKGNEEMVGMSLAADPDPESDIVHAGIADLQYFRLGKDGRELDVHRVPDLMMNQRVAVSPDDPSRVYVGSANYATYNPAMGKICISHDRGDTWARAGVTYDNDDAEGVDEVEGTGADGEPTGLPADNAPWWDLAFAGPPPTRCPVGLSADPTDADHVVAGLATDSIAYESTDGGKTWTALPGTLVGYGDQPGEFWQVFFAKGNQLAISGDGSMIAAPKIRGPAQYYDREAAQWTEAGIPFDGFANPFHVERDPNTDGRFIVSFIDAVGGLYETRDGGETWTKLLADNSYAVAIDQQHPDRIAVASIDEKAILLSIDGGSNWTRLEQLPYLGYGDNMAFSGDRLVVGVAGSSYYTTDISDVLDTSPPPAPTALRSPGHTSTTVDLAWDAVTDPETSVARYDIYVDGAKQRESRDTTATVSGLAESSTHEFAVTAVDAAGNESPKSNAVTVTTDSGADTTPPTAPANLRSPKQTHHSVHLNWDASQDRESSVDRYNVSVDGSKRTETDDADRTPVNGLESDTEYEFFVTAVDAAGNESDESNRITVRTTEHPGRGDGSGKGADGNDEDGDGYEDDHDGADEEEARQDRREARNNRRAGGRQR